MLHREEIEKIARERGEQPKLIEKDYLLEMMLFLLQEHGKNLIFKGGTALYKFHGLKRLSEDLDFTLKGKIDARKLMQVLVRKLRQAGISARIKEFGIYKNQQNMRLELLGPLFDGNPSNATVITINISMKERPLYEPHEERIYSQYRDIPSFSVQVMPLPEIVAEKIRALFTRDKARDVYDLWFLMKKGVSPQIKDINKKLKLSKEKFTKERFIEKTEEKRKSWEMDLKGLIKGKLPDFESIKEELLEQIKTL